MLASLMEAVYTNNSQPWNAAPTKECMSSLHSNALTAATMADITAAHSLVLLC